MNISASIVGIFFVSFICFVVWLFGSSIVYLITVPTWSAAEYTLGLVISSGCISLFKKQNG